MDWTQPIETTQYLQLLTDLKNRDVDSISLCLNNPTNPITGMMKYDRARNVFQEWTGSAWADRVLAVAGGGTGTSTSPGALGTMAYQNANAVNITGGTIGGNTVISTTGSINSGSMEVNSSAPSLYLVESTAPVNQKDWHLIATGNILYLQAVNDARNAATNVFSATRSGYTVTGVTLETNTTINGYLNCNDRIVTKSNASWLGLYIYAYPGGGAGIAFTHDSGAPYWMQMRSPSANQLQFLDGGGNAFCTLSNTGFHPWVDNTIDLGTASGRWRTIHGNQFVAGTGSGSACSFTFEGYNSTGMWFYAPGGQIVFAYGSTNTFIIDGPAYRLYCFWPPVPSADGGVSCGISTLRWLATHSIQFIAGSGSGSAPSYTFGASGNTGISYLGSAGNSGMTFWCDGIDMFTLDKPNGFLWVGNGMHIAPRTDNTAYCGTPTYRWYLVCSVGGVSTGSDIRLKDVKGPTRLGLNFINKLNPVEYTWITRKGKLRHGIIAQELKATLDELKVEFDGLYEPEREAGQWGLNYSEFIAPIIKAIQELDAKVDVLRSEINAKKATGR